MMNFVTFRSKMLAFLRDGGQNKNEDNVKISTRLERMTSKL